MYQLLIDADILERAIKQLGHGIVRDLADGGVEVALELCEYGLYLPEYHLVFVFSKWHNTAFADGEFLVGDDFVEVNLVYHTKTFTMRTSTLRRIE